MEGITGAVAMEEVNGATTVNVVNEADVNCKLQFEHMYDYVYCKLKCISKKYMLI